MKSCNFYKLKNKNNEFPHKRDQGKLSITMGLSVEEFLEKNHLTRRDILNAEIDKKDLSQITSKYLN